MAISSEDSAKSPEIYLITYSANCLFEIDHFLCQLQCYEHTTHAQYDTTHTVLTYRQLWVLLAPGYD
jgi:hypothetical protein